MKKWGRHRKEIKRQWNVESIQVVVVVDVVIIIVFVVIIIIITFIIISIQLWINLCLHVFNFILYGYASFEMEYLSFIQFNQWNGLMTTIRRWKLIDYFDKEQIISDNWANQLNFRVYNSEAAVFNDTLKSTIRSRFLILATGHWPSTLCIKPITGLRIFWLCEARLLANLNYKSMSVVQANHCVE